MNYVRVFRILEYTGSREAIEHTIEQSIHGTKVFGTEVTVRAATLGTFPEIIAYERLRTEKEKEAREVERISNAFFNSEGKGKGKKRPSY